MAQYDIVFIKNDSVSGVSYNEYKLQKPPGAGYSLTQDPTSGLLSWVQAIIYRGTLTGVVNLNDYVSPGYYRVVSLNASSTSLPDVDILDGMLTVTADSTSIIQLFQCYSRITNYRPVAYTRGKKASTWSSWTGYGADIMFPPAMTGTNIITLVEDANDPTARLVTDSEKVTWNGKLPSTGLVVITQAAELGSYTNQVNTLQILQSTASKDAFMTFHIAGDYAAHFGLDYVTNDLFFGGWSLGAVKNRVWHAGNTATLKSSLGSMPASDVYAWAKASTKPSYSWSEISSKPTTFAPIIGTGSTDAGRGDYANIAYNHSQAAHAPSNATAAGATGDAHAGTAHAPSNAQANADITKAEIEAKLTGVVSSHDHKFVINLQTGTTYTLVLSDAAKLIRCNNAAAITLTIPPNSSVAFDVGTIITVEQQGAGVITVAPGSGVTINSAKRKTDGQYAVVQVYKVDTDVWNVIGGIE